MQDDYYQNQIYPLQDKILTAVGNIPVDFYLTGGTALSRGYLHHRYSDDLDFFVNRALNFKEQVEIVVRKLSEIPLEVNPITSTVSFLRLQVSSDDILLKIDFVNDIEYRYDKPQKTEVFIRTDHPLNILTNKICALTRYDPKDIADILYICKNFSFNWEEIISIARKKDIWVEPIEVSRIIHDFPLDELLTLKWIVSINLGEEEKKIKQIALDILNGSDNNLYKK